MLKGQKLRKTKETKEGKEKENVVVNNIRGKCNRIW